MGYLRAKGFTYKAGGGGSALTIKEEGSDLTTEATSIDIVGAALTATESGDAVTITQGTWGTSSVIGAATMTIGSDADGDTYYRASNVLTRLAKGSPSEVLTMNAGATAPEWAAAGGGSAAGSDGQLQYNNGGSAFGGAAQLNYDDSNSNLGLGTSTFNASAVKTLALASGTAPAAGTSGQCSLYAKDASVDKLLLHFDGANDGTTITDSGVTGHTVTLVGNVHTDTAIKKFGTASAQFDGVGDYLTIPHHTDFDFGTGDYTFDFQIYTTSFAAYTYILRHWSGSAGWFIRSKITTGDIEFQALGTLHTSTIPLTLNTWTHIAVCRSGTTTRLFVDGVEGFSYSVTEDIAVSQTLYIGGTPTAYFQPGYIDELRITKGTAHYTAGFTPPVAAHTGSESEAYVLDQNGNETKLSAHNEANEWEFVSKNKSTGKCVRVNMERMIKRLEELHPGENFMEEWNE